MLGKRERDQIKAAAVLRSKENRGEASHFKSCPPGTNPLGVERQVNKMGDPFWGPL